jgi:hypothetical protein
LFLQNSFLDVEVSSGCISRVISTSRLWHVKQGVVPTMVNSWATTIMLTGLQKMQYSLSGFLQNVVPVVTTSLEGDLPRVRCICHSLYDLMLFYIVIASVFWSEFSVLSVWISVIIQSFHFHVIYVHYFWPNCWWESDTP